MTAHRSNKGQGIGASGGNVLTSLEVQLGGLLDLAELQILGAAIGLGSKPIVDRAIAHVAEMAASRFLYEDRPVGSSAPAARRSRGSKIISRPRLASKEINTFL